MDGATTVAALIAPKAFNVDQLRDELKRLGLQKNKGHALSPLGRMKKPDVAAKIVEFRTYDDCVPEEDETVDDMLETATARVYETLQKQHIQKTQNDYWNMYQHFVTYARKVNDRYVLPYQGENGEPDYYGLNYANISGPFFTTYMETLVTPVKQRVLEDRLAYEAAANDNKPIVRPGMSKFNHVIAAIECVWRVHFFNPCACVHVCLAAVCRRYVWLQG